MSHFCVTETDEISVKNNFTDFFLGSTEHQHRFTFFPGFERKLESKRKTNLGFRFLASKSDLEKKFPVFLKGCLFHFSSPGLVGWLRLLWTAAADDSNCHLQNSVTLSRSHSLSLSGSCTLTLSFTNVTVPYRFPTYSKEGVPMRHNVYVCERVCVRVREIERVCASTYLLVRACVCVCV